MSDAALLSIRIEWGQAKIPASHHGLLTQVRLVADAVPPSLQTHPILPSRPIRRPRRCVQQSDGWKACPNAAVGNPNEC